MKKTIIAGIIASLGWLLSVGLPVFALAAYTLTFTITESVGNSYTGIPMVVSLPNEWYADHGYINPTGLDTRVMDGSTTLKHMVADDKLLFVGDIGANSSRTLQYTSGNSPVDSFPIITGYGGCVTTPDNAALEIGGDGSVRISTKIDINESDYVWFKGSSLYLYNDGGYVWAGLDDGSSLYETEPVEVSDEEHAFEVTVSGGEGGGGGSDWEETNFTLAEGRTDTNPMSIVPDYGFAGGENRYAVRVENFQGTIRSVVWWLRSTGSPTGYVYCNVRDALTDEIIGEVGAVSADEIDSGSSFTEESANWTNFSDADVIISNPTDIRITAEYDGTDWANSVSTKTYGGDTTNFGVLSVYNYCDYLGEPILGWQDTEYDYPYMSIYGDTIPAGYYSDVGDDASIRNIVTDGDYLYISVSIDGGAYIAKVDPVTMTEVDRFQWETGIPDWVEICYDPYSEALFASDWHGGVYKLSVSNMEQVIGFEPWVYGEPGSYLGAVALASADNGRIYGCKYASGTSAYVVGFNVYTGDFDLGISTLPSSSYRPYGITCDTTNVYVSYSQPNLYHYRYLVRYLGLTLAEMDTDLTAVESSGGGAPNHLKYSDSYLYYGGIDGYLLKISASSLTVADSWYSGGAGEIDCVDIDPDTGNVYATYYNEGDGYYYVAGLDPTGMSLVDQTFIGGLPYSEYEYGEPSAILQNAFVGYSQGLADGVSTPVFQLPLGGFASTTLSLYVDGVEVSSTEAGALPDTDDDWVWRTYPYSNYIQITVGGVEALYYQPEEMIYGDTLPDLDGTQDGIITWGGVSEGIAFSIGPLTPSNPAKLITTGGSSSGLLLPDLTMPPTMYTELDTSKVPGGEAIDELLEQGDVPKALWWYPFVFIGLCIAGLLIYEATTRGNGQSGVQMGSLLTMCIFIEVGLIGLGLLGVQNTSSLIPLFPAFLFPIPASALTLSTRHVGFG